jgi:UDP-N-acetylglucosamine--N-acetylmuramyl-(pentapeptide) pyrophosphoryl-undecaprenol N-acetylglucosamine transferase
MLLIPLRGSGTRGDQVENANYFQNAGSAHVLGENTTPWVLLNAVNSFARDEEKRKTMSAASAKIGERDGAVIIARALADELERHFGGDR